MRSFKIRDHAIPLWLVTLMLVSGTISGILAYRLATISINVQVNEPIEVLSYSPHQFSLYPGEKATFSITLLNHASINYSVSLDFQLSNVTYQTNYVTFSDETYNVIPGQQNVTGWLLVKPNAPPTTFTLTVGVERGENTGMQATTEDFLTYQVVDPNSHIIRTTNHIDFSAYRDEAAYVYKDKGTDYFGSNWFVNVDVKLGEDVGSGFVNFFTLANTVGDWKENVLSGGYELMAYAYYNFNPSANGYQIGINEEFNGNSTYQGFSEYMAYNVQPNVWYYCTIGRVGQVLSMKIYSDSARIYLLQTLSFTLKSEHGSHRYVYAAQSFNSGGYAIMNIGIENLTISKQ